MKGIAVAIALSICASGCEGRKGEPGAVGPPGEKGERVLRGLLVHRALRALPGRQVRPRMVFELYVSTARGNHAEGSATRMRYLS
jgi:hypothetical protein